MDESIDRKWMSVNRYTNEYEDGVKSFVRFAYENAEKPDRIVCPCLKHCYSNRITPVELKTRLSIRLYDTFLSNQDLSVSSTTLNMQRI
ncbi:hypothetical protein Lal_00017539 [Lupinus albus]|nr:hypothetical protein Lal_00017539 [Lupinus albus]